MEVIQDIVKNGLIHDIYKAERAIFVHKEIAKYAHKINDSNKSTRLFFSYTQELSFNEAILSLSRVFDSQVKDYEIRCLKRLLNHIKDYSNTLPAVRQPYQTSELLRFHNAPAEILEAIKNNDSKLFSKEFCNYYLKRLKDFEGQINELKHIRDKAIAHNEKREEVLSMKWNSMDSLLGFAKEVIGVTGWAFLGTIYKVEERYFYSEDAKYDSYMIEDTLKALGIMGIINEV